MSIATYLERRGELETYFDRTAVEAWARLTSDAPVGRIRATVRAGRDRMRDTLLSWLPADLRGARAARCRLRHRRACRSKRRGAAPRWSRSTCRRRWSTLARERAAARSRRGHDRVPRRRHARSGARQVRPRGRDGLADPLPRRRHACRAAGRPGRAHRRSRCCSPSRRARRPLALMHAVGRLFPRGDRAPAIEPVRRADAAAAADRRSDGLARLAARRAASASPAASTRRRRWSSMRAMSAAQRHAGARLDARSAPRFLPFADAATPELPLGRLLRLSLFQVSVGMAVVLLNGTLNRVMIVELGVPGLAGRADGGAAAGVRAVPRAGRLPLRHPPLGARLAARALHLDGHAAAVRRLRDHAVRAAGAVRRHARPGRRSARSAPRWPSCWSAPGMHTTQTAGLALATDLAPPKMRGRAWWRCST